MGVVKQIIPSCNVMGVVKQIIPSCKVMGVIELMISSCNLMGVVKLRNPSCYLIGVVKLMIPSWNDEPFDGRDNDNKRTLCQLGNAGENNQITTDGITV